MVGIGASYTELNVGCAHGRTKLSPGGLLTIGLSAGVDAYAGYGALVYQDSSTCCNRK